MKSSPLGSELARCLLGVGLAWFSVGGAFGQVAAGRVPEALPVFPSAAEDEEEGDVQADGDFFTDNLNPFGTWVEVSGFGSCWRPTRVGDGWRPYSEGYWAYTDVGWTWVSYEPFGAIVYHYGRWLRLMDGGWAWVPGREWGPAWVSWRHGDDYVGWAPLPPSARWRADAGISTWVDMTAGIGPGHYQFCAVRDFGAPLISRVVLSSARNSLFVQITQNVTNISYHNRRPFCGGLPYDWIAPRCQRPVPRLRLVCEERVDRIRERAYLDGRNDGFNAGLAAGRQGELLVVPAPRTVNVASVAAKVGKPTSRIDGGAVDNGWRGVSDRERRQLETSMARDTAGANPVIAPARGPALAELKTAPKPVGKVEKRDVLTAGKIAPVVAPSSLGHSQAQTPRVAEPVGADAVRLGGGVRRDADELGVDKRTDRERDAIGEKMRRDADSFAETRKPAGTSGGASQPVRAIVPNTPNGFASESTNQGLTRGEDVKAGGMSAVGPSQGLLPTRKAFDGLREQDRRAEELRRQAEQFSKARSPSAQGVIGSGAVQVPSKGLVPSGPLTGEARPTGNENPRSSTQGRAAQAMFEAQKREQQRLAEAQAARERSVRMQAPSGFSGVQRPSQPANQLGVPTPVPARPTGVGAPSGVGQGLPAVNRSVPPVAAPSSGVKKKDEDFKK
jgi:hypothetical protein